MGWLGEPLCLVLLSLLAGVSAQSGTQTSVTEDICGLAGSPNHLSPALGRPFLFVLLNTARGNFQRRAALRSTWLPQCTAMTDAKHPLPCAFKFFIGQPVSENPAETAALQTEMERHQDIVLLDVPDHYQGLVHKVVAALDWAYRNVGFTFLAKTDDDVLLLPQSLIRNLDGVEPVRVYRGSRLNRSPPWRDPKHRYYTSPQKYVMQELPPFIEGPCILLSRDLVRYLSDNKDVLQPFTHVDDPVLALWFLALQVHPQHDYSFKSGSAGDQSCSEQHVMVPNLSTRQLNSMWNSMNTIGRWC